MKIIKPGDPNFNQAPIGSYVMNRNGAIGVVTAYEYRGQCDQCIFSPECGGSGTGTAFNCTTLARRDGKSVYCKPYYDTRTNLEYLVRLVLDSDQPQITVSKAKELLGMKTMEEFRDWYDNKK